MRTVTDPLNQATTYELRQQGQPHPAPPTPLGNVTTNVYDTGGIVIPGTWNLQSTTDALGNTTPLRVRQRRAT